MENEAQVYIPQNTPEVKPVQQKDLDNIRARMAVKTLNITERMVDAMEKLQFRLDGIDEALANSINLDESTPRELYDYFNQVKESFNLRRDFLKTLSGYDVDTTKVKSEKPEETEAVVISDEDAERVKAEIMRRNATE